MMLSRNTRNKYLINEEFDPLYKNELSNLMIIKSDNMLKNKNKKVATHSKVTRR
jgi:hypothetical protein